VSKYGLGPHIRLGTAADSLLWDGQANLWQVALPGGEVIQADIVISAIGMFNDLSWPVIPGRDEFAGTQFHSARWNVDHDLTGKRVGVIGSAASAVQLIPEVAKQADQLHVFQRTANWIMPKGNVPYTQEELARFRGDPEALLQSRAEIFTFMNALVSRSDPTLPPQAEAMVLEALQVVGDADLRAKLTPDHPFGCKRPLFSDNFFPTFNCPNVELVTAGIDSITPTGVKTSDGVEREVDTLIMATGFQTTKFLSALDVAGRGGRSITDAWSDGAQAYFGITTAGFPNLFMLYGPNTNTGSIIYAIERQVEYILRQLKRMDAEQLSWLDVRPEVMESYNLALQEEIDAVEVWHANCNAYYRPLRAHRYPVAPCNG